MKPVVFESRIDHRRSAKVEANDYGAHLLTMNNGSQWSGSAIYSIEVAESAIKVLQEYVHYARSNGK